MVSRLIVSFAIILMLMAVGLTPDVVLAQDTAEQAAAALTAVQAPTQDLPAAVETATAAQEAKASPTSIGDLVYTLNTLWVVVAASLVFIMNLGFGCVESGLTRAKNTTNILFKNSVVPCIGIICFAVAGFGIMFPSDESWFISNWFGLERLGIDPKGAPISGVSYMAYFLFQAMFAATAATIVSGAVAERIKLSSFLVFTVLIVLIGYPITGSWIWGGGWLADLNFHDFAGSTAVHSVGGWGALVGAIMVGPRLGKFSKDGGSNAIPGHNLSLAMIGVFLLWWGWFGFNGGSTISADADPLASILVITCLGASAGGVTAMLASWFLQKKPDFTMVLNGILGGLVAITAGCDILTPMTAMVVGGIGGILAVFSVIIMDQKFRVDDPVGAISVHLVNGIWGTLACGLFGANAGFKQFGIQLLGVVAVGIFTVVFCGIAFYAIKAVMGLRVSDEEQVEGLDLGEHDQAAYPDFQQTHIKSYHIREA